MNKDELIRELEELRTKVSQMERSEAERKKAEESLREQEIFAENLIENSAVATFVLDPGHRVLLWNKACEELTGIPSSDIIGTDNHWKPFYLNKRQTLADVIIDRNFEAIPVLYSRHSRSTLISNGLKAEGWYKNMNGRDRYILFDAAPIFTSRGELAVVIETLQDITELKTAEEELNRYRTHLEYLVKERTAEWEKTNDLLRTEILERKHAEEAMRTAMSSVEKEKSKSEAIIAALGDGVTIMDIDFRILYQNLISKNLLGDHVGEYCYKAYRKRDRACPGCPVKRSFSDGGIHRAESKISTQEKGTLFLEQTTSPLRDASGRIIAGVEVVRNVTERKKMEEELLRTEKLESLGVLSGGIAHDFNNLLTALLGNISLAKAYTDVDDRIYEMLIEAEKASRRARDLTQQLLTFSKGGAPIRKVASISELIKDSTDFSLSGSNVRCELSVPDDLWPAEVDEGQIGQVINNLVINAQQAMAEGGTIRVSCRNMEIGEDDALILKAGRYVEVCVEDEGMGIPPQYLAKVFDPYFTTKQKGSGLGLATAHSIISKHDGFLSVESKPGEGTTFYIFLPASEKEIPVAGKARKKLHKGEGKVLVMDDEDVIRMIVGKMLSSLGFEPEVAESGEEAIEKYSSAMESGSPFDAVIIDLTIRGGMGGLDCINKLLEIDPGVKAIVSSGYSDNPAMSSYREFGFKGIITKPYQIEDLSEILSRILTEQDNLVP